MSSNFILFYDGLCALCNGTVNFVIERDKKQTLKFATLQGEYAKVIMDKFPYLKELDSLILYDESSEKVYTKSLAAFKIGAYLGGVYKLLSIFRILPRFISDSVYDLIARNRYKLFGKYDTCRLPSGNVESRIIE